MNTRTQAIKHILPKIENNQSNSNDNELFQNNVLRPILKFQNSLILNYFENFVTESKIEFTSLKHSHKITQIHHLFKTNIQFKQFYLGLIVAFFLDDDFTFYVQHKKELHKRIIAMLIERLCSHIEDIKS